MQFLQQQLAQVGIKVETKLLEPGVRTELILHVKGAADSKSRLFTSAGATAHSTPIRCFVRFFTVRSSRPSI